MLDDIDVVEHDFQLLRGAVWDLVDRERVLLQRHCYVSLSENWVSCVLGHWDAEHPDLYKADGLPRL